MPRTPSPSPPTSVSSAESAAPAVLAWLRERTDAMVDLLTELARAESPTLDREAQAAPFALLADALAEVGYEVRRVPARQVGDHLYARPAVATAGCPVPARPRPHGHGVAGRDARHDARRAARRRAVRPRRGGHEGGARPGRLRPAGPGGAGSRAAGHAGRADDDGRGGREQGVEAADPAARARSRASASCSSPPSGRAGPSRPHARGRVPTASRCAGAPHTRAWRPRRGSAPSSSSRTRSSACSPSTTRSAGSP